MADELLKTFDDQGNEVEPMLRSDIVAQELPKKYFAGISAIWVVNKDAQILCSQRSDKVLNYPGLWQTFFGGHVQPTQTFLETATRELYEEAGLIARDSELTEILVKRTKFGTYAHGYVFLFDEAKHKISFIDGEVQNTRWLSFEQYNTEFGLLPERWCNGCNDEEQQLIVSFLKTKTTK